MNWFAINEDDQFEIASIQTIDQYDPITIEKVILAELKNNTIQAVENLRKQQNKGKDYFYRIQEIVFNRFFIEENAWLSFNVLKNNPKSRFWKIYGGVFFVRRDI